MAKRAGLGYVYAALTRGGSHWVRFINANGELIASWDSFDTLERGDNIDPAKPYMRGEYAVAYRMLKAGEDRAKVINRVLSSRSYRL